jgi:hypothetical protein
MGEVHKPYDSEVVFNIRYIQHLLYYGYECRSSYRKHIIVQTHIYGHV